MGLATKLRVGSCQDQVLKTDQDLFPHWYYHRNKSVSSEQFLEDEIYFLRRRMEQMFNQEQSLTSEAVIELSNLLDNKINEYMNKTYRNR